MISRQKLLEPITVKRKISEAITFLHKDEAFLRFSLPVIVLWMLSLPPPPRYGVMASHVAWLALSNRAPGAWQHTVLTFLWWTLWPSTWCYGGVPAVGWRQCCSSGLGGEGLLEAAQEASLSRSSGHWPLHNINSFRPWRSHTQELSVLRIFGYICINIGL